MITYRNATHSATAEEAFAAMLRHHTRQFLASPGGPLKPPPPPPPPTDFASGDEGDIIYGARAVGQFLFGKSDNTTRRRVYCLAQFFLARKEKAGFFKLKSAICLSKSQWRKFHGLG